VTWRENNGPHKFIFIPHEGFSANMTCRLRDRQRRSGFSCDTFTVFGVRGVSDVYYIMHRVIILEHPFDIRYVIKLHVFGTLEVNFIKYYNIL